MTLTIQHTTIVVKEKVMKKFLEALCYLSAIILLALVGYMIYGFFYEPASESTQKFFSEFRKNDDDFLLLLDEWEQKTTNLPVQFSAEKVKTNLDVIFSSQSTRRGIESALDQNSEYMANFVDILDGTECLDFIKQIYQPIRKMRSLYYANTYLYKKWYFSNELEDISKFIGYVDHLIIEIECNINDFAREYDGYFDKNGFIKLIEQIRGARNYKEFHEKLVWLEEASEYCLYAYILERDCKSHWLNIHNNAREILEKLGQIEKLS